MARRRHSSSFSRITRYPDRVAAAQARIGYQSLVVEAEGRRFKNDMSERNAYALFKAVKDAAYSANLALNNGRTVREVIEEQEGILRIKKEQEAEALKAAPAPKFEVKRSKIAIRKTVRGTYDFTPPFWHPDFLNEFKRVIGRPFRTWNEFRSAWQIKPVDQEMINLIAQMLERHFPNYDAVINHEVEEVRKAA